MADHTVNDQELPETESSSAAGDVEELRRERDTLQDRLLRTAAEFDNYRKRVERDRREVSDLAVADAVQDLLPVIDNLERALQAAPAENDPLRKGVEMIHRQMMDVLRKRGVKTIDVLGADFDPNIHQAVAHEDSETHREGEVMEELQRGYRLGDRLLRAAMVKVARRP
jgi:molecular chaperone GrpE